MMGLPISGCRGREMACVRVVVGCGKRGRRVEWKEVRGGCEGWGFRGVVGESGLVMERRGVWWAGVGWGSGGVLWTRM